MAVSRAADGPCASLLRPAGLTLTSVYAWRDFVYGREAHQGDRNWMALKRPARGVSMVADEEWAPGFGRRKPGAAGALAMTRALVHDSVSGQATIPRCSRWHCFWTTACPPGTAAAGRPVGTPRAHCGSHNSISRWYFWLMLGAGLSLNHHMWTLVAMGGRLGTAVPSSCRWRAGCIISASMLYFALTFKVTSSRSPS